MQSPPLRAGRTGRIIAVALFVCALVLVVPVRSVFDVANGYLANALLRLGGEVGDAVVAVQREDTAAPDDAEMRALLAALLAAGASQVLPVLVGTAAEAPDHAEVDDRVTFLVPERSAGAAGPADAGTGLATWRDPGAFGYYLPIGADASADGAGPPGFDQVIAGLEGRMPRRYWVPYLSEEELMPIYDWSQVVDGQLPRSAFEGKIVVVAMNEADLAGAPDLVARLTAATVPPATFVVNAIQARVDGRVARALPGWLTLAIMFLAAVEAGVILARLRDRAGPWLLPAALAVIAGAGAGVLVLTGIMFPLAETMAAFALAWSVHRTIIDMNRRRRQRRQLRRLALVAPPSQRVTAKSDEDWAAQARDVATALGLTRWTFFRHRLPRGFGAVVESADPFPDGTETSLRKIARLLDRGGQMRALTPIPATVSGLAEDAEEAWAVLVRGQEAHASVWVVACPMGWFSASPARRATLVSSAEQLVAKLPRGRSLDGQPTLDEEIWQRARVLGEDAGTLDLVTRLASSAFAVYDLTGGLIRQNDRMRSVGEGAKLGLSEMSLLDAITGLTGLGREMASGLISDLISTGETQRLRLSQPIDHRHYDFRLSLSAQDPVIADRQGRFGAIVCELLDVTPSVRLSQARENVTEFFDQQLRNDFEAVDLIVGSLTDETLDNSVRKSIAGRLAKVKTRMLDRMQDFEIALKDSAGAEVGQAVPTELRRALDGAIESLVPEAVARRVAVDYTPPALLSLALASADDLETVFRDALGFCLDDARDGGRIIVNVRESPTEIETQIEATGYGLPVEVFASLRCDDGRPLSDELRRVRDGVAAVESWGGSFTLASELDRGVMGKITLRKVR